MSSLIGDISDYNREVDNILSRDACYNGHLDVKLVNRKRLPKSLRDKVYNRIRLDIEFSETEIDEIMAIHNIKKKKILALIKNLKYKISCEKKKSKRSRLHF